MAIIIGIDPGTQITGYGVISIDQNAYRCLDFGCIRPPAHLPLVERYLIIFEGLDQLVQKFGPGYLAIETQFAGINIQSAIKLGMARGIAIISAKARAKDLQVFEYSPSEVKKSVVGNGRASKVQVQYMTQRLLNLSHLPEPEDAADALALAICHAHRLKSPVLNLR